MVPFAGWSMPIQYSDSIMDSTKHCRTHASLFDVSHMCGLTLKVRRRKRIKREFLESDGKNQSWTLQCPHTSSPLSRHVHRSSMFSHHYTTEQGKDAVSFLEGLVVGDVAGIAPGTGSLSVFTNEKGGIIDDTVVTKVSATEVYLVVNAGCVDKDLAHIGKHLKAAQAAGKDVQLSVHNDRALLALQGPDAAAVLAPLAPALDLPTLFFSHFARAPVAGSPDVWVTRTGYTGEDGFELSIPGPDAVRVAKALTADPRVRLCGLGALDALRLEAGLCLYGNDLTEEITPVEAGLTWTIGKARRDACDFLGGDVIKKQMADGVTVRRVGLVAPAGAPPRQHADVLCPDGKVIGEVTSGAFSPCLKTNIALAYVPKEFAKAGTQLQVSVRGKANPATVTKVPFVANNYYKG